MHADGTRRKDRVGLLGLAVAVALGLLIRLVGVGFLLPHDLFSDSLSITQEIAQLNQESARPERINAGFYPGLLPRLARLAPSIRNEGVEGASAEELTLEEHLGRAARPRRDLRIVCVVLAILAVPATWVLARGFLGPRWALVAAAFMSGSFLDTWYAPQERPHSVHAALALIAVLCLLDLRRRPSLRTFVVAGLSMGLAIGALQSGVAVLFPFAAAVLLPAEGRSSISVPRKLAGTGLALALAALAIPIFYPFLFEPHSSVGSGAPGLHGAHLNLSGHVFRFDLLNGRGLRTVAWTMWSYEPLLAILALAGALAGAWRLWRGPPLAASARADLWVVLAYALPYLVVISLYAETAQRFVLPLVPYAALLAASCLRDVARAIGARAEARPARIVAIALVVAVPISAEFYCSAKLAALRAAPDTGRLAAIWIRAHLEPDADRILVSPRMDLPLLRSARSLERNAALRGDPMFDWFAYQWTLAPSELADGYDIETMAVRNRAWLAGLQADARGYLRALECGYAVLEVRTGWSWPVFQLLRSALQQEGVLLARFDPDGEPSYSLPFEHQDDSWSSRVNWMWRTVRARCVGPVIEIYRLGAKGPAGSPVR